MAAYIPMAGPHAGERYMPSNGTEGSAFIEGWCTGCARDRVENGSVADDAATDDDYCEVLNASFRDEAVEWRELADGRCVCLAFVPFGQPAPTTRCEHTSDLFGTEGAPAVPEPVTEASDAT